MTRSLVTALRCVCLFLMNVFPNERKAKFVLGQRNSRISTTEIAISMLKLPGEIGLGGFRLDELSLSIPQFSSVTAFCRSGKV